MLIVLAGGDSDTRTCCPGGDKAGRVVMVAVDQTTKRILKDLATRGMAHVAKGLSAMLGQPIGIQTMDLAVVPVQQVIDRIGGPEQSVVGIYLIARGDMPGHVMLILPYLDAIRLVDMLLDQPDGTTKELGSLERSALAEVGNLTASYFLNAVAAETGFDTRPSPPAVMVDMLGAVLNIILIAAAGVEPDIMLLDTVFTGLNRKVKAFFWVVPDLLPLQEHLGGMFRDA